jgi:hypothetical protein
MSDLEPRRRSGSGLPRKAREQRAYTLTLATGGLAVLTLALIVLAVVGVTSFGLAIVAALLTAGSGFLLRRTLGP